MKLLAEAVTAFLFCAAVVCAVQLFRHLRPPRLFGGDGLGICFLIAAQGPAPGLERMVRTLLGGPCGCILIADCGLTEEARRLASILQREHEEVLLLTPDELPKLLEVTEWTPSKTP